MVIYDEIKAYLAERSKPGPGGCIDWTLGVSACGYGQVNVKRWRTGGWGQQAHRLAWVAENRQKVPAGQHVMHTCHRPVCINPGHLVAGSPADNIKMTVDAGRKAVGSAAGGARLTTNDVLLMRWLWWMSGGKWGVQAKLARRFGVSEKNVTDIVRGARWKHVPVLRGGVRPKRTAQSVTARNSEGEATAAFSGGW